MSFVFLSLSRGKGIGFTGCVVVDGGLLTYCKSNAKSWGQRVQYSTLYNETTNFYLVARKSFLTEKSNSYYVRDYNGRGHGQVVIISGGGRGRSLCIALSLSTVQLTEDQAESSSIFIHI